jgi:hypothetical protein
VSTFSSPASSSGIWLRCLLRLSMAFLGLGGSFSSCSSLLHQQPPGLNNPIHRGLYLSGARLIPLVESSGIHRIASVFNHRRITAALLAGPVGRSANDIFSPVPVWSLNVWRLRGCRAHDLLVGGRYTEQRLGCGGGLASWLSFQSTRGASSLTLFMSYPGRPGECI